MEMSSTGSASLAVMQPKHLKVKITCYLPTPVDPSECLHSPFFFLPFYIPLSYLSRHVDLCLFGLKFMLSSLQTFVNLYNYFVRACLCKSYF